MFAEGWCPSILLDLSLPRFPAKAVNSEVMKLTLEPEEGGGLVTGAGTEAPPGVERDEKHRHEGLGGVSAPMSGRNTSPRGPRGCCKSDSPQRGSGRNHPGVRGCR